MSLASRGEIKGEEERPGRYPCEGTSVGCSEGGEGAVGTRCEGCRWKG